MPNRIEHTNPASLMIIVLMALIVGMLVLTVAADIGGAIYYAANPVQIFAP